MSQTHEACNNKYKKCPEIPVSLIAAILVHIPVGMAFVVVLLGLAPGASDSVNLSMKLLNLVVNDETLTISEVEPEELQWRVEGELIPILDPVRSMPVDLPVPSRKRNELFDPLGLVAIPQQVPGPEKEFGSAETQGQEKGGKDEDSTAARSMRWVLRFKVNSGQDYLDQLKSMKAEIVI